MSGAYAIKSNPEKVTIYELLEDEEQRARRARILPAIYALVDPKGWDALRLAARADSERERSCSRSAVLLRSDIR